MTTLGSGVQEVQTLRSESWLQETGRSRGAMVSSSRPRKLQVPVALLILLALVVASGPVTTAAQTPTLVDIRAAHHPGFDRVVFEFKGPPPEVARVKWASAPMRLDPSHTRAQVHGNAFLKVRFRTAVAHQLSPPYKSTALPHRRASALPNVAHLVLLGDHEGTVSLGIGLMKRTRILRATTLGNPSRFVIDVATNFRKGIVKVFFVDDQAVIDGKRPYVVPVDRKVPRGARPRGALLRLYAGPTQREIDRSRRFVASGTTGFRNLRINDHGVARVTLRGPCDSGGAAEVTVASQVLPTLRSRPSIDWIKIYDRDAETQLPWGRADSLPTCLEP
jgi:hypothetical protein